MSTSDAVNVAGTNITIGGDTLGVPYGNRTRVARREREVIYRNSKETCGMDSTGR